MKQHLDKMLLLGGLYVAVGTPLEYFQHIGVIASLSTALLWAFIFFFLMLCFNYIPRFLDIVQEKYPRPSYYLKALGWIPYVMIGGLFVWNIAHAIVAFSERTIDYWAWILGGVYPLVLGGLLYRAYRIQKTTPTKTKSHKK